MIASGAIGFRRRRSNIPCSAVLIFPVRVSAASFIAKQQTFLIVRGKGSR